MCPLDDPVTWYGINYAGTQLPQWDLQVGLDWYEFLCLEVPLCSLRPSIIYSIPCDLIVQRTYYFSTLK